MRFVEFTTGLQTYVTKEEQELIEQVSEKPVRKRDLTEREQEVARRLTEKSILIRQKQNDNIIFKLGKLQTT
tara:strand:+ start:350 stop:565 length:216 start_codon:yes stop_codon:yes gene_type:complete